MAGYGLGGGGLYKVENPMDRVNSLMGNAASTTAAMSKGGSSVTKTTPPGPTVGGVVSAGLGGAATGAMLAKEIAGLGLSTGAGAAIVAPIAIGAYLFG